MSRLTPELLALLLVAACGGDPSGASDCQALTEAVARDACWAARLSEASLPATERLALAQRIEDAELRDLALAEVAPGLGLDACQAIQDPLLRDGCSTRARRPHLSIPEPAASTTVRTEEAPVLDGAALRAMERGKEACQDVPEGLRDHCLQRQALAEEPALGWALCTAMGDPDQRGDCDAAQGTRLGAAGDAVLAARICASTPDASWRDECFFRTSEALPLTTLAAKAEACERAGRFRDECFRHLVQAAAQAGTLRGRFGDLAETLEGLDQDWNDLAAVLPADADVAWHHFLFAYEAYHALLGTAAQHERLASAAVTGERLLANQEALPWWRDCAQQLCVRTRLEASGAALAGLDEILAPCPRTPDAPRLDESAAVFPGGDTPVRYRQVAISEVPAPLWPGSGCAPGGDARQAIVGLWALEPLPWAQSTTALDQALRHPATSVRAYALDMAEHKAFFWHRDDDTGGSWLAERLATVTTNDPHPPIRARAGVLVAGLEAGERPARWAMAAEGACSAAAPTDE